MLVPRLLACFVWSLSLGICANRLGINWETQATHPLPPMIVAKMLKENGITKVKLFDAKESVMSALVGTGIEVMVASPNKMLAAIAGDYDAAKQWVHHNITRYNFNGDVNMKYVAVGNEPFLKSYNGSYHKVTFSALAKIQNVLNDAGVGGQIRATVPLNADIYDSEFPSAGKFRSTIGNQMEKRPPASEKEDRRQGQPLCVVDNHGYLQLAPPILLSPQILEQKFGRKGVKFIQPNGIPIVELAVRNGSSLQLTLSDGLVTSYKPKVYWKDDGFEEVVHTLPTASADGAALKGGIGLVLNDLSRTNRDGSTWSASQWDVKHVNSDSIDAVQVELTCTNGNGALDITYVVSLFAMSMATAVIVKNKGTSDAELTSGILSHLKFKSRKGSAVTGLIGCSYCAHPPLLSRFSILSQAEATKPEPAGWNSFSFSNDKGLQNDQWNVEDNKYVMLRDRLSRVYTAPPVERLKRIYNTPPSKYETIDQGSGLGFRIIRMGYDDIYLSSPGSFSEKFGKDYFICTGPASMLVPVVLKPGEEWRGAQVLEHDNL